MNACLHVFAAPVLLFVIGCSSFAVRTAENYDPGQVPRAQFVKDSEVCEKQAEADQKNLGMGAGDPTHATHNRMYDACMQAIGYRRKPE